MMLTPEEARVRRCHASMDVQGSGACISDKCMAWRWRPLQTDEAWREAVKKVAAEIGDTTPSKGKAAKIVTQNRAKYGLPDKPFQGWCGRAGKPE